MRLKGELKLPVILVIALLVSGLGRAQIVPKKYLFNQTFTYDELIRTYQAIEAKHPTQCKLIEAGKSDGGKPIHTFVIDSDGEFTANAVREKGKRVLFILNGIHPGEPDGIDASVEFAEELILESELRQLLAHVTVVIVPVYNPDGMLMRGNTRANQNGPEEGGFRANARNLDLNRDCLKEDSKNAQTLAVMLSEWKPEFFVDTHVSNGADYRYVMTLIPTAPDKMEDAQRLYMVNELIPKLKEYMKLTGYEMAPYVNLRREIPDSGILAFNDSPRYTTGFASLFGSIGFTTETHMLKPFPDRVKATKAFLTVIYKELGANYDKIHNLQQQALYAIRKSEGFYLNYENDLSRFEKILFKGYEAEYIPSTVSDAKRLSYNRSRPYDREIAFYPYLRGKNFTQKPAYYVIPQAWGEVIERLRLSGVPMDELENDTTFTAEVYIIEDFKGPYLYEGHAVVYPTKIRTEKRKLQAHEGDVMVKMGTDKDKFVMAALEPMCKDSYFQWGFFNSILERKEYFSGYVFEDIAAEMLKKDPKLKAQMEDYFSKNSDLNTPENRLEYIYDHSTYVDPNRGLYPIYRLME